MVTLIKYGALSGGEKYNVNVLSIDGLSIDTKPTVTYIEYGSDGREVGRMGIPNGSIFTEIDTGDTYMYDVDATTWHKVSIGGGGGGGGGFTPTDAQLDAMNSGITSEDVEQISTNKSNISLITPELIELVDSGAKNELELITPYGNGITNNPNLTVTLNSDQTITVNGSVTRSGAIVISNTISGKLGKYLSGRPTGITADIRLSAYSQPSWSAAGNDYNGKGATITDNGNILIAIYIIAGQTYSNLTFKPMICTKAAWDVSQKFVPYRPTYEETVEQVAENETNISSIQQTIGDINSVLEEVL